MKGTIIFKLFMITALFFLSSCKEYFITTKINSNGTCERTIVLKADGGIDPAEASEIKKSGWNLEVKYDSVSSKKYIHTATKTFATYEELNQDARQPKPNFKPTPEVKVEKQFRFFFTYFTYKETYKAYNVYDKIPINKFFTEEELNKLKEGKDSAWVKQKFDLYENVIKGNEYFDIIENFMLKNDGVDISKLVPKEKRLGMLIEVFNSIKGKEDKSDSVLNKYYGGKIAKRIEALTSGKDKSLEKKFSATYDSLKEYDAPYENAVIMPGIITASNSKSIEGNKVTWKFDQEKFKFFDFEMAAESREVNTWFIIVSGIVVLLLIALLILPKFRRKTAF